MKNWGEVIRVLDFVDYKYDFKTTDASGNLRYPPEAIYRNFFIEERKQ